jgi:spore coat protein U-like protein
MKALMRKICGALMVLGSLHGSSAWAVLACSIGASPSMIGGVYSSGTTLNVQGGFSVTCTRDPANDATRHTIWIGLNQAPTGSQMTRDIGGSTLNYAVYRQGFGSSLWTNTGSKKINQSGDTGMEWDVVFAGAGSVVSVNIPFYWQLPTGQNRAAGVYLDTGVAVSLHKDNAAGALLGSTLLNSRASIQHNCRFSSAPLPIQVFYTAFATAAVPGSTSFELTCTEGTTYALSLDLTRSVIPTIELAYSLALNATSGTGNAVGQSFRVDVSIDAGQAGNCVGRNCSGTDTRTITVTY